MNGTVPRISPENVRPERPTPRKLLARPKSEILTVRPSGVWAIRMFSGLMSRCTNPSLWACLEALQDLAGQAARLVDRIPAGIGLGQGLQVGAGDVLHGEPELPAGHPLFVAFDDIGMADLADDRHLALEAVDGRAGGGCLGHDQLQRDHPAGHVVTGLVDHAHGAATQLAEAGVIGDGLRQAGGLGATRRAPPLDRLVGGRPDGAGDRQAGRRSAPQPAHRIEPAASEAVRVDGRFGLSPDDIVSAVSTTTRKTLCPAAIMSCVASRTRSTR